MRGGGRQAGGAWRCVACQAAMMGVRAICRGGTGKSGLLDQLPRARKANQDKTRSIPPVASARNRRRCSDGCTRSL